MEVDCRQTSLYFPLYQITVGYNKQKRIKQLVNDENFSMLIIPCLSNQPWLFCYIPDQHSKSSLCQKFNEVMHFQTNTKSSLPRNSERQRKLQQLHLSGYDQLINYGLVDCTKIPYGNILFGKMCLSTVYIHTILTILLPEIANANIWSLFQKFIGSFLLQTIV